MDSRRAIANAPIIDNLTDIEEFKWLIKTSELSLRAKNVLINNVQDIKELIELNSAKIVNFLNCGIKTVNEILRFQERIRGESGYRKKVPFSGLINLLLFRI